MRGLLLVLRVFEGNEDGDDDDGVDESGDVHLVLHEERDDRSLRIPFAKEDFKGDWEAVDRKLKKL